jgi:[acyl-carrier-protein] S-malonyltransferase
MAIAFTFPGQGSQAVGMGAALYDASLAAREVFGEVDEALGQNLFRLMREGPIEQLTLTENAQPALMAVSMAVMRVLEREGGFDLAHKVEFVAGHSLGEYSALAAAGSFSLSDAARLLKRRGEAMQRAVPVGEGGMAAIIGASYDDVAKLAADAAQGDVCAPANDNADGQVVISGSMAAIDRALTLAKERGIRRAVKLNVSAPFHSSLMRPAADEMAQALAGTDIAPPAVPLVANVTAAPVEAPDAIRRLLVEQVTGAVRWRESVAFMAAEGVSTMVEIGAGKVLSGLAKRINRDLTTLNAEGPEDIEALLKLL